jgi:hypothetical protein
MSVCSACASYADYECKQCYDCDLAYCSTDCGRRHLCQEMRAISVRPGEPSEKFLQKPGVRERAVKWRARLEAGTMTCLLCGGTDQLARSGVVLCTACHLDFVEGKRAKKKRPPPVFRIEDWVSTDDMKVVEQDRREHARMYKIWRAQQQNILKWERMIDEMCENAPGQVHEQCYQVWDSTQNWELVVNTYDILIRGGKLPSDVRAPKKEHSFFDTIMSLFSRDNSRVRVYGEVLTSEPAPVRRKRVRDSNVKLPDIAQLQLNHFSK